MLLRKSLENLLCKYTNRIFNAYTKKGVFLYVEKVKGLSFDYQNQHPVNMNSDDAMKPWFGGWCYETLHLWQFSKDKTLLFRSTKQLTTIKQFA